MPKKKIVIVSFIFLILVGAIVCLSVFDLKTIRISGCETVDEETVRAAVEQEYFTQNTLLVYLESKLKPIEDIPFVARMDVNIISSNEIEIMVYEKSMAGCVEYMNGYVYFDKDGVILDASNELIAGVPCIKGLNFSEWEIGKKLPIDDESRFQSILSITQLVEKYELEIDGIEFTAENEIVLFHDGIIIELGEGEYLAIQMMNLGSILEGLEGMEGTLYMKDFNSENATASFSKK